MSICGIMLEQFKEYYGLMEGEGKQKVFPTPKTDMVEDDDGNLDSVIMRKNEEVDDYDIEDPHQKIRRGENVQRVDPEALDFLNQAQRQE